MSCAFHRKPCAKEKKKVNHKDAEGTEDFNAARTTFLTPSLNPRKTRMASTGADEGSRSEKRDDSEATFPRRVLSSSGSQKVYLLVVIVLHSPTKRNQGFLIISNL